MTKVLAVVISLYYLLVSGSVEYPMPYASCLGCCGVLFCCVSLSCSSCCFAVLHLSLSSCVLLKEALWYLNNTYHFQFIHILSVIDVLDSLI